MCKVKVNAIKNHFKLIHSINLTALFFSSLTVVKNKRLFITYSL